MATPYVALPRELDRDARSLFSKQRNSLAATECGPGGRVTQLAVKPIFLIEVCHGEGTTRKYSTQIPLHDVFISAHHPGHLHQT